MAFPVNLGSLIHQALLIGVGITGIGFLIGFHELGHFLFAKLFGISTPSFSIGMGPKLIKKKIGETEFSLSALPLGGYVEIAGMAEVGQGEQKEAYRRDDRSFATKPFWQKFLVLFGGILFNLLFAYVALSFLFFIGMPRTPLVLPKHKTTIVCDVTPGSPAEQYGLLQGDTIVAINDQDVTNNPELLVQSIQEKAGENVKVTVERAGEQKEVNVTVGSHTIKEKTFGFVGIDFEIKKSTSLIESIKDGFEMTNTLIVALIKSFKNIFVQRETENLCGPLMVISQTIKGAEKGFKYFLLLLAFISVNLAVLNLIPLPIVDGGQILFYSLEAIFQRPLSEKIREYIHIANWIAFLILIVYLSYYDILRMFFNK